MSEEATEKVHRGSFEDQRQVLRGSRGNLIVGIECIKRGTCKVVKDLPQRETGRAWPEGSQGDSGHCGTGEHRGSMSLFVGKLHWKASQLHIRDRPLPCK